MKTNRLANPCYSRLNKAKNKVLKDARYGNVGGDKGFCVKSKQSEKSSAALSR